MSDTNGKKKRLRFAPLVRVSTEQQEKLGESLRTQRSQNEQNVELLGGTIVGWYGGQEHATPGWEKKEIDRLIADAAKGKFDAIIMNNADRWSRDNTKSTEGLEALKKAKVRFFVGVTEYDLYNPEHQLFLGLSSVIGQFQAANANRKSILNRIARLRRGIPATGRLPFGRTFNRETGEWGLDPKKQELIVDVAKRYLAGEQLPKLAEEYGMNHSQLCLTLRERCGDQWVSEFHNADMNIHETITLTVPRLLDEATVRAVKQRLKANRTYIRSGGRPTRKDGTPREYLLGGYIFCAGCGYNLCGSTDQHGVRHYNHTHAGNALNCPIRPRPWVRSDKIEEQVIRQLFDMFGNPTAIERAVKAAVPDCERALKQRERLQTELAGIDRARTRLLGLIEKDAITDAQAEPKLRELKERQARLEGELDNLNTTLANVPDEGTLRCYVDRIQDSIFVYDEEGNTYAGGNDVMSFVLMTQQDRRNLVKAVFDVPLGDGTPAGVYVSPVGEPKKWQRKQWEFKIRGRLEFEFVMSRGRHSASTC